MPEDQGVNVVYFEIPKAVDESIKEKAVNVRFRVSNWYSRNFFRLPYNFLLNQATCTLKRK